jgi:DNA-binding NtrC family response regulator
MISERIHQLAERARRAIRGESDEAPRVLCADDDENVRTLCSVTLKRSGFEVDLAENGREAIDQIDRRRYTAVLLDLGLPHLHGTTVLSMIRQSHPEMLQRIVVITGATDAGLIGTEDVRAVLRKPFGAERLVEAIHDCCAFDDTVRLRSGR